MKKQVVRAGKYISVGILFIACLPVLLPLLFLLSIFGFTFVLPLACALAGFLYLRKYVGMLYRKLPSTLGGCSSWGRRRPLPGPRPSSPLFIDLPLRDQQAIETFESVDPEFDAVVISTAPREEERGSVGGAGIGSEPEAVSSTDVSADDGAEREGVDADKFDGTGREDVDAEKFIKDGIIFGENEDDTIADNGTNREGTDDDETAQKGIITEGSDYDVFTESRTRPEGAGDDISAENWSIKERVGVPTFAENGTKREETHDDTSPENVTRRVFGEDNVSADDRTKKEGIGGDIPDDDVKRSAGIDDDTSLDETRGHAPELDISAKDGTGTEWNDTTWTRKEAGYNDGGTREEEEAEQENERENLNEGKTENTMPNAANNEESFESPEDFGRTSGIKQIEERSKQDEVHAKPDGGSHPEVDEEEGGSEGVETPSEETKEHKFEAVSDECVLGEFGDDQHGKSVPLATEEITPDSFDEASVNESPTKPDGVRHLLPHQANEDDIWICKECGWRYPNAKPSAKIRRNHKKHCVGSSPRTPAPEGGVHTEVISPGHEHHTEVVNLDTGGTATSSIDSGEHDEQLEVANEFPSVTSESFRSAPDEFPHDIWSSFDSVERYDDEQDQLTQVQQELQLSDDLNAVKGIVGDKHVSTGPLLTDIEELSQFLGIDLPVRSADLPEIEWAKLAIEVMKVVVGID